MNQSLVLTECPRDAFQGFQPFIPTLYKVRYYKTLLQVGFSILDCGSFVSPKAVPQMADTAEVIQNLEPYLEDTFTKLLVIVLNERGAQTACTFSGITYLGYSFSLSETFQIRNTNATIEQAFERLLRIRELAEQSQKRVSLYLSMAFGNPYGDPWSPDLVLEWAERFVQEGFSDILLADTVGNATVGELQELFSRLTNSYPQVQWGAHLHASPDRWQKKVKAALENGASRIDSALLGYGGCPFAQDELVGNIPTEQLIPFLKREGYFRESYPIQDEALRKATLMAQAIVTQNWRFFQNQEI